MKMDVLVLNKNFYEMDNQRGANVTVFGEFIDENYQSGISISEAPIPFEEHKKITVFPARYRVTASIRDLKNRSGKKVTGLFFSDFEFMEELELKPIQKK